MTDQQPLEWIQSMRLQLLDSLFELSSEYLQAASWVNPTATNPHYTLIEFIESSPLRDMPQLEYHKATGVIRDDEYSILLPLVAAITAYTPPGGDWYNHEAVLRDPKWLAITQLANAVLGKLLPPLTEAQKAELDRRLADHLANPDDVVSWDEVKAAALAKIRQ